MRETRIWSLGWEDPMEKGKATQSSILTLEVARSQTWLSNFHFLSSENEMIRVGLNSAWLVSLDEREVWTQTGIERRPYEDTDRNLHIKERGLAVILILDFYHLELWDNKFLFLKLHNLWQFLMAALEKEHHWSPSLGLEHLQGKDSGFYLSFTR